MAVLPTHLKRGCFRTFCIFQGVVQLAIALSEEPEDHIQAAAAWALGQIGRHTPEHAKAVAVANVLPKLLQCYLRADASEDLQTKVRGESFWIILFKFVLKTISIDNMCFSFW